MRFFSHKGTIALMALAACSRKEPPPAHEVVPPVVASAIASAVAPVVALVGSTQASASPDAATEKGGEVRLTSSSFSHNGSIPKAHTCQGSDRSPALSIHNVPAAAKSLVLVVDDPDAPDPKAPKMTWVHWVLYNLPVGTTELAEAAKSLPSGTREGKNSWKRTGYGGPCPPIGRHRYFHKLYALDVVLPDLKEPDKAALEAAMQGHVIAKTELIGTYQKE